MTTAPAATDAYLESLFVAADTTMADIAAASRKAGLADIAVSPLQGKFLMLLAMM